MKRLIMSIGLTLLFIFVPSVLFAALLLYLSYVSTLALCVTYTLLVLFALYFFSKQTYDALYKKRVVELYTNDILFHYMRKSNRNPADRDLTALVKQLKQYTSNHQKEVEKIESKLK